MKMSALLSATALAFAPGLAFADDYYATVNVDAFVGGAGDDDFIDQKKIWIPGDSYDGGAGTDTLWITLTMAPVIDFPAKDFDYRTATLKNIEVLAFNYMLMEMPGNVIFNSTQFGAGLLPNDLKIYGAWGDQDITVNLPAGAAAFDASGWRFMTDRVADGAVWGPYNYPGLGEVGGNDTIHINGSSGNNTIVGTSQNDILAGAAGDDVIEGGPGADWINGGAGIDAAAYMRAPAAVTVSLANGGWQNTVGAGADKLAQIENLIGSGFNDTLWGNADDNVIEGGPGNDWINGGAGSDTASYARAPAKVRVDLTLGGWQNTGGAGVDKLIQIENILGSAFDDTLVGNGEANIIEGGPGADWIYGGGGSDTASYAGAPSRVKIDLSILGWQDTLGAGFDKLIQIENLLGSPFSDTLIGNAASNVIEGGAGDDRIDGAAGADIVSYEHAPAGVTVDLTRTTPQNTGGAGVDTLSGFEGIIGTRFADVLNGGANDDYFEPGAGHDRVNGGGGSDTVAYKRIGVAVTVDLAVTGVQNTGAGASQFTSIENVIGGAFDDTLSGNSGANLLVGGPGRDVLRGRGGRDVFSFWSVADSAVGARRDVVADFGSGVDLIDLSAIDANTAAAGDQAFAYIGASPFSGAPGQLRFSGGILSGDVNGDKTADFEIELTGVVSLNPVADIKP
jgi:Ca2+-binding RTX toxin-like protein